MISSFELILNSVVFWESKLFAKVHTYFFEPLVTVAMNVFPLLISLEIEFSVLNKFSDGFGMKLKLLFHTYK